MALNGSVMAPHMPRVKFQFQLALKKQIQLARVQTNAWPLKRVHTVGVNAHAIIIKLVIYAQNLFVKESKL